MVSCRNGFFGHPKGLTTLFLIEMWERLSFYGMAALLTFYMSAAVTAGGLGYSQEWANRLFGIYIGVVFFTPLIGGIVADRWLGARRTMLLGGLTIAMGHLVMTLNGIAPFYGGLALIALGTGLLKPNINTLVGSLYEPDDPRRTAGFNLVYMGINVGAMIAPLLCGFLGMSPTFQAWLKDHGFNPLHSWHWGFAAAGVGMCFGLIQYWLHRDRLAGHGDKPQYKPVSTTATAAVGAKLSRAEWHRLYALGFLLIAFTFYSAISLQAGSSIANFAKHLTRCSVGTWQFEPSYVLALNPLFVILLTPAFAWVWTFLGRRGKEPSEPLKFAFGLAFVAVGTVLIVPPALHVNPELNKLASPWWLVGVFFFQTMGELCMSPVGNAAANRLAPARYVSLITAIWYCSSGVGSFMAGGLSGTVNTARPAGIALLFAAMAAFSLALAVAAWKFTPKIKSLMEEHGN